MHHHYNLKNNFKRRDFIGGLGATALAGLLPFKSSAKSTNAASMPKDQPVFLCKPYLQNLHSSEVTIIWITALPCKSWVECTDDKGVTVKYVHVQKGLIDAYNFINRITVKSLKPGRSYSYKVISQPITDFKPYAIQWGNETTSDAFTFTTPGINDDDVSCIVFNDVHDRPASFPLLYNLIKNFQFDFVTLNGDMFDFETDQAQLLDHLILPLSALFSSSKPFYFLRGNHETRGKFARNHFDYVFDNPGYFSFKQGPVYFTFLDTGEDKPDDNVEYSGLVSFDEYREQQADWFASEIESKEFKKAPFRIVFMHIPPFQSGDWHGTMHCRQLFNPLFNKGKVDLVVCGHTHKYGIHHADAEHHYPIVIGGGPLQDKRTIITLQANKKQVSLNMIRDDGTVVGTLNLNSR